MKAGHMLCTGMFENLCKTKKTKSFLVSKIVGYGGHQMSIVYFLRSWDIPHGI
jgi:hypothetical protein